MILAHDHQKNLNKIFHNNSEKIIEWFSIGRYCKIISDEK